MIQVRRKSAAFTRLHLNDDTYFGHPITADQVHWYHPDGTELSEGDWHSPSAQALAMEIISSENQEHWLLLFNASAYHIHYQLPELKKTDLIWQLVMDTRNNFV